MAITAEQRDIGELWSKTPGLFTAKCLDKLVKERKNILKETIGKSRIRVSHVACSDQECSLSKRIFHSFRNSGGMKEPH